MYWLIRAKYSVNQWLAPPAAIAGIEFTSALRAISHLEQTLSSYLMTFSYLSPQRL